MDPFSGDDTFGNRGFHGRLSGRDRDPCRSFRPIPGRHRDRRFPEARRPWNIFPGFPIIFREKSGHLNAFSGVVTFNQQSPSGLEAAQKESGLGRRDRRQAARGPGCSAVGGDGFRKSAGTAAGQHPERAVVSFEDHGFIKIGGDLFSAHFSNPHLPIVRRLGIGIAASGPAADAEEPAAVAQAHWAAAEEARGDAAEFAPGQDSASGSSQTITRS